MKSMVLKLALAFGLVGCTTTASQGTYGLMLVDSVKKSERPRVEVADSQSLQGESCTGFFFIPIGDGFQYMQRAVEDAVARSGDRRLVGLANAALRQEFRWYFLYFESCWVVEGQGARLRGLQKQ